MRTTLNLPTILTLLRIFLIPVFIVVFYLPFHWSYAASAVIFAIAGITDWLDGYLARKWNQTSTFGAFLDPVADKLIVVVALLLLVGEHGTAFLAVPAAVIVCREITVSALREWMAEIGKTTKLAVSMMGKFKTGAQMGAIFLLLTQAPSWNGVVIFGYVLMYLAAVLTLWSMILYLKIAWPHLLQRH